MKTRALVGIAAFVLTLAVMIPALFFLSRGAVNTSQYVGIVTAVVTLVLWMIPYAAVVDPWLRRGVGALFGTSIEWRGTGKSTSWTPEAETGCIATLFIDLLGYLFILVWPGALIGLVLWFHH